MESQDLKYNKVLDKLKNTEPVLNDAEVMTDMIMQKIEKTVVGAGRNKLMRISGFVSGIAASALICLFAYETLKYPVSPVNNFSTTRWETNPHKLTELSNTEKAEIIGNILKSRKAQSERKEKMSAAFIACNKKVIN